MGLNKHATAAALWLAGTALATSAFADSTVTIATVNNVQMIEMQKLAPVFEKQHPDIPPPGLAEQTHLVVRGDREVIGVAALVDCLIVRRQGKPIRRRHQEPSHPA